MPSSDLATYVADAPMVDSHTHLRWDAEWVGGGVGDVLVDLFGSYSGSDLLVAGASEAAIDALLDPSAGDVAARFGGVRETWEAIKHTGYAEATRLTARLVYGVEQLTPAALAEAEGRLLELRRPGEQQRLLRDVARLEHVQSDCDGLGWDVVRHGTETMLFDLDMTGPQGAGREGAARHSGFIEGLIDAEAILIDVGVEVTDVDTLREALVTLFAREGRYAIAVKTWHAYRRTLRWVERSDVDADQALVRVLAGRESQADRLCVGDWCMARIAELAAEHGLPLKIHCGYENGTGHLDLEQVSPVGLCPLLTRFPETQFVLMHLAYPFVAELTAIAKHFPNVWLDFCWAWTIDPPRTCQALRQMLHAVPASKLLVFGSDTTSPTMAVGFAAQARLWLTRALESEIADAYLTTAEAIALARRLMYDNQYACFDVRGRREALATL